MGKEILTFGDIEVEKNKFYHHKILIFLRDLDIEKKLVSGEKTINTLFVTCIMIMKLNHYI